MKTEKSIIVGSKVKLRGRPTRGVSFKVISIDRYMVARIKHSMSELEYFETVYDLELVE